MRLAFFQRLDQAGGGSRASLRATLHALRELRPDWPLLFATQEDGPLGRRAKELGIAVLRTEFRRFRKPLERLVFWRECRKLAAALGGFSPEAILSNEWVTAPHALSVARRLGIPAMSYVRDFAAIERGRKYQLHRMDRLLCVSESMRQGLIREGYDPEKVRTVYNPVLRPVVREMDPAVAAKIAGASGVDRWMLYLGRISSRKNQVAAVETLKQLREISGQRWGLLLVGDEDDTYVPEVDRAVAAAGLENVVLRLGMIPEPGALFELAEISLMTSKSEGLARVLVESFLCGKPAFALPQDGLEDIYGDAIALFVPSTREPSVLAATIAAGLADGEVLMSLVRKIQDIFAERHSPAGHVTSFEAAVRMV